MSRIWIPLDILRVALQELYGRGRVDSVFHIGRPSNMIALCHHTTLGSQSEGSHSAAFDTLSAYGNWGVGSCSFSGSGLRSNQYWLHFAQRDVSGPDRGWRFSVVRCVHVQSLSLEATYTFSTISQRRQGVTARKRCNAMDVVM